MAKLPMLRATYRDKVLGCWTGMMIGGTLGNPLESKTTQSALQYFDPIPGQATARQEFDSCLVWLDSLQRLGPSITADQLTDAWLKHLKYKFDASGWALWNLKRGMEPPLSGSFDNWFKHSAGAIGRAPFWGMIAPGSPQIAAAYAWQDASIDHAEEGVWAAMFWAAAVSAAFIVQDPQTLLDVGLAMIPSTCRTAIAIRVARDCYSKQTSILDARISVTGEAGWDHYTDAPQNSGFLALGLLYGAGDFGSSLCATVNCGCNSGLNGSTLGALMGVRLGYTGIPSRWIDPIGDNIIYGWGLQGLVVLRTVGELATTTVEISERVISERSITVEFVTVEKEVSADIPEAIISMPVPTPAVVNERAKLLELDLPVSAPAELVAIIPITTTDFVDSEAETVPEVDLGVEPVTADSELPTIAQSVATPEMTVIATPELPLSPIPDGGWTANSEVKALLVKSCYSALVDAGPLRVTVDYGEFGPCLSPNQAVTIMAEVRNEGEADFIGTIAMSTPEGWQVAVPGAQASRQIIGKGRSARFGFVLKAPDGAVLMGTNSVQIVFAQESGAVFSAKVPFLGGSCWWVVGPFKNMSGDGFDKAFEVESKPTNGNQYLGRNSGLIGWQKNTFRHYVIDLEPLFGGMPGVAYAKTTVRLNQPLDARLVIHCNDGVQIWLNGQKISRFHDHSKFSPTIGESSHKIDVSLNTGENRIMLKIVRCDKPVLFGMMITDRGGNPLEDMGNTRWFDC